MKRSKKGLLTCYYIHLYECCLRFAKHDHEDLPICCINFYFTYLELII